MLYKPIDDCINVSRVLARNHEATNFPIGNGLELPAQKKTILITQ
jgi:hypothetical protein